MIFKEFLVSKRIEDPEVRQAVDLDRSDDTIRTKHKAKSSVSVNTLRYSLLTLGGLLSLGAIAFIGTFVWKAIQLYIGS